MKGCLKSIWVGKEELFCQRDAAHSGECMAMMPWSTSAALRLIRTNTSLFPGPLVGFSQVKEYYHTELGKDI